MATIEKQNQRLQAKAIDEYLQAVRTQRESTYKATRTRLAMLPTFVSEVYGADVTVDDILTKIKSKEEDQYKVLARYAAYINEKGKSADRIRKLVQSARLLFEFHGVEYSLRQFNQRVKLPRVIRRAKNPTDKNEITEIIQTCQDAPLQLALFWHASTGRRPEEIFSLRHCDLDFTKSPAEFHVRGEYTKMGIEHIRPMTDELAERTKHFITWKHRKRSITEVVGFRPDGRKITRTFDIAPQIRADDLLFAEYRRDETHVDASPHSLYEWFATKLMDHLDSIGKGQRVSSKPGAPHKFTFYRLRDFVKTTVSDLGFGDFAEWLIGHNHSTYYSQTREKQIMLFRKIEPYLTFADFTALEAKSADTESKIDALEQRMMMYDEMLQKVAAYMPQDKITEIFGEENIAIYYPRGQLKQLQADLDEYYQKGKLRRDSN